MSQGNLNFEDLLANDYFIQWVLNPTPAHQQFWTAWRNRHPERAADLEKARQIILLVKHQPANPTETAEKEVWDKIDSAITTAQPETDALVLPLYPTASNVPISWFNRTRRLAASLVLVVLALSLGYYLLLKANYQNTPVTFKKYETPLGKRATILLADGTEVILNAGSSLRYPVTFAGQAQRQVHLQGEAFFKVVKNKEKAFVVNTAGLQVKVLGTSFNLKAYPQEETIQTTLVEGKVELNQTSAQPGATPTNAPVILRPNQKANYTKHNGKLSLTTVDPHLYTAWIEGRLIFKNTPLGEVIRVLNRTYNVQIQITQKPLEKCTLTADLTSLPLPQALTAMCRLVEARFTQKGNNIIINGKGC